MNNVIKGLIVLFSLMLLALGVRSMFMPNAMIEQFAVTPEGAHGLNTIRGDIGGLLIGSALMGAIGLLRGNTTWFLAVAVMMLVVAFGRLVGFALDGFETALLPPFVIEIIIASVMVTAHRKFGSSA